MIDPDSFIVQRDPTTGSLKYLIPEEAMSRHFGLPVYQERERKLVPLRKIGWAALVTFFGLSLLSFSAYWLKYRPRGVDRYAPTFSEQSISMTVSTAYEAYPICFTSETAFTEAGRVAK